MEWMFFLNCLHKLFLDQFTIWMKWFEHLWQKKDLRPHLGEIHPRGTDDCFSVFPLYLFFKFIYDCFFFVFFTSWPHTLQHRDAAHLCSMFVSQCVGKLDRLSSLQHVSGGSLTNKYWTIWLHVCDGVGRAVFLASHYVSIFMVCIVKINYIVKCVCRQKWAQARLFLNPASNISTFHKRWTSHCEG